jgi:ArsR family transcriptional regulator
MHRNIDVCQYVAQGEFPTEEWLTVRELPLLDQPQVVACCAPLATVELREADAETLARQFAALSDPIRLRLVSLMANADGGAICACDLVEPVGRSQPTVSHHLKILTEAGLVTGEKRGRNVWYGVVPAALESLRAALATG